MRQYYTEKVKKEDGSTTLTDAKTNGYGVSKRAVGWRADGAVTSARAHAFGQHVAAQPLGDDGAVGRHRRRADPPRQPDPILV